MNRFEAGIFQGLHLCTLHGGSGFLQYNIRFAAFCFGGCIILMRTPVFTAASACPKDPVSLGPLDCESTATVEMVPGALLDYTGTTTRVG